MATIRRRRIRARPRAGCRRRPGASSRSSESRPLSGMPAIRLIGGPIVRRSQLLESLGSSVNVDPSPKAPRLSGGRHPTSRRERRRACPRPPGGALLGDRGDLAPLRADRHRHGAAGPRLRIRGGGPGAGDLSPGLRQSQDAARARAAAQLRVLVRDSTPQDRAAPQADAGLAVFPTAGDAGRPRRRTDRHGGPRSPAQVLRACSIGWRPGTGWCSRFAISSR